MQLKMIQVCFDDLEIYIVSAFCSSMGRKQVQERPWYKDISTSH